MRNKTILVGLFFSISVLAQGVIDEVIWVVGDEAILRSEVDVWHHYLPNLVQSGHS